MARDLSDANPVSPENVAADGVVSNENITERVNEEVSEDNAAAEEDEEAGGDVAVDEHEDEDDASESEEEDDSSVDTYAGAEKYMRGSSENMYHDEDESLIRRQTSSFAGSASWGGGGDGRSSSSPYRPRGAVKPDKKGIHIVPKNDLPIPGEGCIYSAEILKRAKAKSSAECAAAAARGEVVLEVVKEEVCHICHNRKAVVLNFCCGDHGYCDFHCASRLGFRAKDFDKENPTVSVFFLFSRAS